MNASLAGSRPAVSPIDEARVEAERAAEIAKLGPLFGSGERSVIAQRLDMLRSNALAVVRRRERVPQPLFWSLLHTELSSIKREKERKRLERESVIGSPEDV